MQTLDNANWTILSRCKHASTIGKWPSTTWSKLTLLKCVTTTNTSSFRKQLTNASNAFSEIGRCWTSWKRDRTHQLFASIKMKKLSEFFHPVVSSHTNVFRSWSHRSDFCQTIQKIVTLFSELCIANIFAICTIFQATRRVFWPRVSFLKNCCKCMSPKFVSIFSN